MIVLFATGVRSYIDTHTCACFKELGSGAFSIVYKGKKKDTGDVVAIKHISKKDCSSKDDLDALMEEVSLPAAEAVPIHP